MRMAEPFRHGRQAACPPVLAQRGCAATTIMGGHTRPYERASHSRTGSPPPAPSPVELTRGGKVPSSLVGEGQDGGKARGVHPHPHPPPSRGRAGSRCPGGRNTSPDQPP